jgi:peptide-methionine (S)-S-oxide reductase
MPHQHATVGGGCFWCLEAVFESLEGVAAVESGYAGGSHPNPSYREVCSGATGHAEVIRIAFDPEVLGFGDLLEVFFAFHDPTTPDRQGPDLGSQYRSIILTESTAQRDVAEATVARLDEEGVFGAPIVTEIRPLDRFWPAESDHHQYYQRNPDQAYCRAMIAPKIAKLRAEHAHRLRR